MKRADTDLNAVIDLNEFVQYMLSHERKLYLAFTSLDKNSDGELSCILAKINWQFHCDYKIHTILFNSKELIVIFSLHNSQWTNWETYIE